FNEKGVSRSKEFAFMTSQWKRVGYQVNDRIVTLRGNVIPSAKNQVFWEYEPIKNRLILSTYHMNENSLTTYIEKIRQFKPQFIHTYPSAVTVLAKFMVAHHIPPFPTLKAVLCSSEAFYPGQRELLENAFQCRIFSWYGLGEMVALAGECEYSHKYHIFPEYGYVELIDANGKIIDSEGTLGEIVGTGFDRDIMPFIRYRTGDFAEYSDEKCSCGRNYRLLKRVEGRWLQEQIFTKKKNLISVTALNMHTPVFENVAQYQFEQSEIGRLILKLVPKKTFQNSDIADIKSTLTAKLDPSDIELEIKLVDTQQIESGRSGKFRFLIQNIK
ncbi:MAG TPA: phenylacetate--CoA ligase family protein, partial [bacterium]|nr:phenylacetate--CoA ligase family protein [bacterium]